MKNIAIQGLGFVGSATAVAVASRKDKNKKLLFNVVGVDQNNKLGKKRINFFNEGKFPIETSDKKIIKLTKESYLAGNLKATHLVEEYSKANVIISCINLDLTNKNGKLSISMSSFKKSIKDIANNISKNTLVIIQSTVPTGTCINIIKPLFDEILKKRNMDPDSIFIAHSYERVMPGQNYLNSVINYWRVYSGINDKSAKKCKTFLSKVINIKKYPLTKLSNTNASETAKLLENSYRATNIAFIEEWSRFAEDIGVDLYEVVNAIQKRPTHSNIMRPGFGVGGYCLTKDPLLAKIESTKILKLKNHKFDFSSKAVEINNRMPIVTFDKIKNYYKKKISGKKLLLMGITYRPDIGDTRFSPSEIFYKHASRNGVKITAYDPLVEYWDEMKLKINNSFPNFIKYNVVVFAVKSKEYAKINFKNIKIKSHKVLIVDSNNVLSSKQISQIKDHDLLKFISIGRG